VTLRAPGDTGHFDDLEYMTHNTSVQQWLSGEALSSVGETDGRFPLVQRGDDPIVYVVYEAEHYGFVPVACSIDALVVLLDEASLAWETAPDATSLAVTDDNLAYAREVLERFAANNLWCRRRFLGRPVFLAAHVSLSAVAGRSSRRCNVAVSLRERGAHLRRSARRRGVWRLAGWPSTWARALPCKRRWVWFEWRHTPTTAVGSPSIGERKPFIR
jgi:hypothetical protein